MGESIAEFMERQRRRYDRFTRETEAAAHEAYRKAIRAGRELNLRQPGDVMRHGAELLQDTEKRVAGAASKAARQAKRQGGNAVNRIGEMPGLR